MTLTNPLMATHRFAAMWRNSLDNSNELVFSPDDISAYVTDRNGAMNVRDFGAAGDGVTDDAAAIDRCVTAARAAGVAVLVPTGTYKRTTPWKLRDGDAVIGISRRLATITFSGCDGFQRDATQTSADYVEISGLTIVAGDIYASSTYKAINCNGMRSGLFRDLRINYAKYGLFLQTGSHGCFFNTFRNIEGFGNQNPLYFDFSVPANGTPNANKFYSLNFSDTGTWGVGAASSIVGITLEGIGNWFFDTYISCGNRAVLVKSNAANNMFFGFYVESSPTYAIDCPNGAANGFNWFFGIHSDGAFNVNDPNKSIAYLDANGPLFSQGVADKPSVIVPKYLQFNQMTEPSAPPSGAISVYMNQADGKLYAKRSDNSTVALT